MSLSLSPVLSPPQTLQKLWQKGCDFLHCDIALLAGAMTWVSERTLVSAISNTGAFGVLACGSMTPDLLKEEIKATQKLTRKSFGVNLITLHPALMDLISVCIETGVSHVVLAGGIPPLSAIQKLKEGGIKVLGFAPALIMAKRLIKNGIDALIIEGSEAGGHIGPVSTSVLSQEILPEVLDIPVFVAGGIGRGEAIVSYLKMGASGCQLGTRFVCAFESQAHPHFKKAFLRANARDAIPSTQLDENFPVIPVRALANPATKLFDQFQREIIQKVADGEVEQKEGQLQIEHFWAGALRRAVVDGDVETGSLMAGQSVGMITKEQSVQEIIHQLIEEAQNFIQKHT